MLQPFSCGKMPLIALYGAGVSILNCAGMASVGRSVVWRNGIPEYQNTRVLALQLVFQHATSKESRYYEFLFQTQDVHQ